MTTKAHFSVGLIVLAAAAAGAMAFKNKATGPVYVYTQCLETGRCTDVDSTGLYIPVDKSTPGAQAITGNLGNPDGKGRCDTIFVLTRQP